MSGKHGTVEELVAPLRTKTGGFAMLALDQREPLRRMFPLVDDREVDDEALRDFKDSAIRLLSPFASGILLDRPYAVATDRPSGIADGCGLILAVDELHQPPGRGVLWTSLDETVTPEFVRHVGAVAVKLLVIWRPDRREAERGALVRAFIDLADQAGVASLVEGIAKPADGDEWESVEERHEGILAAASELGSYGGTIYKAEVPGYAPGDVSRVREHAERLTQAVPVPWVVLSNGTAGTDFGDALREACLGGAAGFLAGRAVWADTVPEGDTVTALEERAVGRLRSLAAIVAESRAA